MQIWNAWRNSVEWIYNRERPGKHGYGMNPGMPVEMEGTLHCKDSWKPWNVEIRGETRARRLRHRITIQIYLTGCVSSIAALADAFVIDAIVD